jgi:predicted CxxxxCH...CXXCH cytochrome family protein
MRTLTRFVKCAVLAALACALWCCSSSNSAYPPLNVSGQHPSDWYLLHRQAFIVDKTHCFDCHGADLHGGISKVSCFSASVNGLTCHPNGPSGHPTGWRDPGLHGSAAKSQPGIGTGFATCQSCHGIDFTGGFAGVSCFLASTATGPCHVRNNVSVGAPHPPLPWRSNPSPTHTSTVDDAAGSNAAVCAQCHTQGANLSTPIITTYVTGKPGCFNSTLCHGPMGHPAGWAQPSQHGAAARANLTYCQQCHADNPTGGPGSKPRFNVALGRLVDGANTGCEVCHAPLAAHPRVLQIPAVFGTLSTFTPIGTPWYLHCKADPSGFDACNRCHGAALDGVGAVSGATGCTFCHRNRVPTSLLDCASCHFSPPNGSVYPNIAGVHVTHVSGTFSPVFTCSDCHFGIGSITLDHFNRAKAHTTAVQAGAVVFGAMAATGGLTPAYNATTQQCTNTYCHGNSTSIIGGTNKSPIWNQTNYLTAAGCGTCHGFPPAAPHTGAGATATQCINCHPHVNASGTGFTDPTKHINGVIDATGGAAHSFPYPGSVHKSAAGASPFNGCLTSGTGCHTNAKTVNYPYPPASAVPPDCQGCHVKASPGNSCGSCHGTASNGGRPNGSSFPDVAGQHSNNHGGFSCSTCHGTAGTGQTTHGSSNFTAHTEESPGVFVQLPAGITFLPNNPPDGHGSCTGSCNGQSHSPKSW